MAAAVKSVQAVSQRRLEKFHLRCKEKAKSKKLFDRSFVVESDHILQRGQDQNSSLRSAIQRQHMAALIIHGRINYETCVDDHPIELAVDGWFRDFKYIEFGTTNAITEVTIPRLQIRLVIRDRITKLVIVTVYPDQKRVDDTFPEVPSEFW